MNTMIIHNTSLIGSIPSCLSQQHNFLQIVNIHDNPGLNGSFPELNAINLTTLILSNNGFDGPISSILPLDEYHYLNVAAFHSNHFYDDDVGPLLRKLFEHSPNLQALTLYDNDYIGGRFPSFEHSVHLPSFHVLAAHGLDLRGTLPQNLYFGGNENITSYALTLYDNRLSGKIPIDMIADSSNGTLNESVFVFQGNLFEVDFPFLRYSDIPFVESIKVIDDHLTEWKLLLSTCVLLVLYPLLATYYSITPILDHFALFYIEPTNVAIKVLLALILISYNVFILNITLKICVLGNAVHNIEQGVVRAFSVNLLSRSSAGGIEQTSSETLPTHCESHRCFVADEEEEISSDILSVEQETTCSVVIKFMIYTLLFLINLFLLICYLLIHWLPEDNITSIRFSSWLREISTFCISAIIAVNSSLIIPNFVDYFLRLFRCSKQRNFNKCVLIIRSITTIVIPIILSFVLLNECGGGWTYLWKQCIGNAHLFDVVVALESYIPGFAKEQKHIDLAVLHHDDVCSSHSFSSLDWNKCIRSFLYHWNNVLMLKMVIMMFMPIFIILKQTLCQKVRGKETKIEIDSEYTMLTTKLEIVFAFGVFSPFLYPLIVVSMNSFIFFYVFAAKTLKWKLVFTNCDDGLQSFPFQFLSFGILCQQILTFMFMRYSDDQRGWGMMNEAISWGMLICYLAMDIFAVFMYRKRKNAKIASFNADTL